MQSLRLLGHFYIFSLLIHFSFTMESMFGEIRDPSERVRALCSYACQVDVDVKVPAKRYFRSGLEMVRMANVYYSEGDLEKAFMLYSKFLT